MTMNLDEWSARVANWKKSGAGQKSLEWHISHLHSEVSEVFEALRDIQDATSTPKGFKGVSPFSIITMGEKDGHPHPEGFGIELADVMLVALYIAAVTGVDIEAQMEHKMTYNEMRRAK